MVQCRFLKQQELLGFVSIKQGEIVEDGYCPFKIVFDEDFYVHFMCIFAIALSVS